MAVKNRGYCENFYANWFQSEKGVRDSDFLRYRTTFGSEAGIQDTLIDGKVENGSRESHSTLL